MGREISKSTFPIDDVDEKTIRKKAKFLFNSIMRFTSKYEINYMCDFIKNFKRNNQIEYYDNLEELNILICERNKLKENMTYLYDSYFKTKSISKEFFVKMKTEYGSELSEIVENIKYIEYCLYRNKQNIKELERLENNVWSLDVICPRCGHIMEEVEE